MCYFKLYTLHDSGQICLGSSTQYKHVHSAFCRKDLTNFNHSEIILLWRINLLHTYWRQRFFATATLLIMLIRFICNCVWIYFVFGDNMNIRSVNYRQKWYTILDHSIFHRTYTIECSRICRSFQKVPSDKRHCSLGGRSPHLH